MNKRQRYNLEQSEIEDKYSTWWQGYQWPQDLAWWHWCVEDGWFIIGNEDGRERACIPLLPGGRLAMRDIRVIGQLIKMYARRRLKWHFDGTCPDPYITKRGLTHKKWEEVLDGKYIEE